ncbi:MAG: hypothetical protein SWO11_17630 [Thermodesulfobacteriota bacterium]|nr:hypothetical protein [Thermodesulfobacteriota bacterium]
MIKEVEYAQSVYFVKLAVQYEALTNGYIDGFVPRKLRSVLKGMVQSTSPCLNARDMNCTTCPFHSECCYFNLMVEKRERDFLPYFIDVDQNEDFHGRITAGERHAFHIGIIGEKIGLAENVEFALRQKPYIFLNGIRGEKTHFQVSSIEKENNGQPIKLNDLMDRCASRFPGHLSRIHRITLDFVSPLSITYGGKLLQSRWRWTFEYSIPSSSIGSRILHFIIAVLLSTQVQAVPLISKVNIT